jgi:hypothetical protein
MPQITAKGWDKLDGTEGLKTLFQSYAGLEKLMGADKAGKAVVPPDPATASKSDWDAFYSRLGRPEKAEGYGIKPPEGVDPALASSMATKFHEMGLTKAQADALVESYGGQIVADQQAWSKQTDTEFSAWARDQGANMEKSVEAARRACRELGFGENDPRLNAFERAFGTRGMLDMFGKIGNLMLESPGVGNSSSTSAIGGLTSEGAKSRIATLSSDSEFQGRLNSNMANVRQAALAEWTKLHETAYPG